MPSSTAPTVSVIIAAYNSADTIAGAVASAQEQTLVDIEILVVDDASDDATVDVARAMSTSDPRVRVLELARNGGPGVARNAGLEAARGDWVAVLDADDAYARTRLEQLLRLAHETGADMVSDNLRFAGGHEPQELLLDPAGDPLNISALQFVQSNMGARGQGRVSLGFLKPMVRASFVKDHHVAYSSIRMSEDYFFALDCLVAGATWVVTRVPTYRYTVTDTSLTATYQPEDLEAVARLDLALAQKPAVSADPGLARQVRRHGLAAHDAAVWTGFVNALRRRDARVAWRTATGGDRAGRVVASRAPLAAGRVVGRRLRPSRLHR